MASAKPAAPHVSWELLVTRSKAGVRPALQWGQMLSAPTGFTRCNEWSPLTAGKPQLLSKEVLKPAKGPRNMSAPSPRPQRPVLCHAESNCSKSDVDYWSREALIKPIYHPPTKHITCWAWQTWFMPPEHTGKRLSLLVLHSQRSARSSGAASGDPICFGRS